MKQPDPIAVRLDRRQFLRISGAVGTASAAALLFRARLGAQTSPPDVSVPYMHGYLAADILSWSAETDPYAKYFRSRVPLAQRIPTYAATQANPALSDQPRLMNLSTDYLEENAYVLCHKYLNTLNGYAPRFWQYVDMIGPWHGLPVPSSSLTSNQLFGVINLPNPAWTDVAHRNGAISLGCWYWPRTDDFNNYITQNPDGSFPLADKLLDMAQYFGFDGYFINQEATITSTQAAALMSMFIYMRNKAAQRDQLFHLQYYDADLPSGLLRYQNTINANNSPWVTSGAADSIFVNYPWSDSRMATAYSYITDTLKLDPYLIGYAGANCGDYGFNPQRDPRFVFPEGGTARMSYALFVLDFYWRTPDVPGDRSTVEGQQLPYTYERQFWSGQFQDPTHTGRTSYTRGEPGQKLNPEHWDGIAHYIVEKSAIGSFPFVTRFNTGSGPSFFVDGVLSSSTGWANESIQDILPTWQWWAKTSGTGTPLAVDYDYTTAYNGPTSLKISGKLGPSNPTEVRLFKTRLQVTPGVQLILTYQMGRPGVPTHMSVGLIFEDSPDKTEWLGVQQSMSTAWSRKLFELANYSGRTIAAISLLFSNNGNDLDYSANIGELALLDPKYSGLLPPASPMGFKIDQSEVNGNTATLFLSWDFAASGVWYYDIYRVTPPGLTAWVGRIYDEVYYIESLERIGTEATTQLQLIAVGFNGMTSEPATASFSWA